MMPDWEGEMMQNIESRPKISLLICSSGPEFLYINIDSSMDQERQSRIVTEEIVRAKFY